MANKVKLLSRPIFTKQNEVISFELVSTNPRYTVEWDEIGKDGVPEIGGEVFIDVRVIKDGKPGAPASLKVRSFVWQAIVNKKIKFANNGFPMEDTTTWYVELGPRLSDVDIFPRR
jgi:hypothetical protein